MVLSQIYVGGYALYCTLIIYRIKTKIKFQVQALTCLGDVLIKRLTLHWGVASTPRFYIGPIKPQMQVADKEQDSASRGFSL